jgi:hypothetical protein
MYGKMTGGKLDPQVLTADQVAQRLQPLGLWAAGNVVTTRTAETTRTVLSGNSYASWADLQRLASTYGWSVTDAGTYSLATDPATIRTQTCDTLPTYYDHGFTDAWGMYDYPSGQYNPTAGPIINACFVYARVYGKTLNTGPNVPAPYSIRAESLDGGNCNVGRSAVHNGPQAQLRQPSHHHLAPVAGCQPVGARAGLPSCDRLPAAEWDGAGLGLHQPRLAVPLVDPGGVLLRRRLLQRRPGGHGQLERQCQRGNAGAGGAGLGSRQPQ